MDKFEEMCEKEQDWLCTVMVKSGVKNWPPTLSDLKKIAGKMMVNKYGEPVPPLTWYDVQNSFMNYYVTLWTNSKIACSRDFAHKKFPDERMAWVEFIKSLREGK